MHYLHKLMFCVATWLALCLLLPAGPLLQLAFFGLLTGDTVSIYDATSDGGHLLFPSMSSWLRDSFGSYFMIIAAVIASSTTLYRTRFKFILAVTASSSLALTVGDIYVAFQEMDYVDILQCVLANMFGGSVFGVLLYVGLWFGANVRSHYPSLTIDPQVASTISVIVGGFIALFATFYVMDFVLRATSVSIQLTQEGDLNGVLVGLEPPGKDVKSLPMSGYTTKSFEATTSDRKRPVPVDVRWSNADINNGFEAEVVVWAGCTSSEVKTKHFARAKRYKDIKKFGIKLSGANANMFSFTFGAGEDLTIANSKPLVFSSENNANSQKFGFFSDDDPKISLKHKSDLTFYMTSFALDTTGSHVAKKTINLELEINGLASSYDIAPTEKDGASECVQLPNKIWKSQKITTDSSVFTIGVRLKRADQSPIPVNADSALEVLAGSGQYDFSGLEEQRSSGPLGSEKVAKLPVILIHGNYDLLVDGDRVTVDHRSGSELIGNFSLSLGHTGKLHISGDAKMVTIDGKRINRTRLEQLSLGDISVGFVGVLGTLLGAFFWRRINPLSPP